MGTTSLVASIMAGCAAVLLTTVGARPCLAQDLVPLLESDCIKCHSYEHAEIQSKGGKHGTKVSCLDCHGPHTADQAMTDCRLCHQAHSPNRIVPPAYASISLCRPCHNNVIRNLRKTTTSHGTLRCTNCHKGMHPQKAIRCRDCHGLPHDWKVHKTEKKCLACHGDPHLLT